MSAPGAHGRYSESVNPRLCSKLDAFALCEILCFFVPGVSVTRDADTWVVGQHAIEPVGHRVRSVRDNHLASMERISNARTATVVEGNPTRSGRCIKKGIEDRP